MQLDRLKTALHPGLVSSTADTKRDLHPFLAQGDPPDSPSAVVDRRGADPQAEGRIRTILVVDDDRDVTDSLCTFLQVEGFTTHSAQNGKEALDQLRSRPLPDLILLDLMMPVMDGWDLYDIVRCDDAFQSIAVIAMSALGELPKTRNLPQVLRKPLDLQRLLGAIRLAQ